MTFSEVVLSVLLPMFRFSLSNKEIVWNVSFVKYPTVGKKSNRPSMPLKLEFFK